MAATGAAAADTAEDEAAERVLLENLLAGHAPRGPPLARKAVGGASPAAKRPRKQSSLDAFFRR